MQLATEHLEVRYRLVRTSGCRRHGEGQTFVRHVHERLSRR
jgi:hypothetical protein